MRSQCTRHIINMSGEAILLRFMVPVGEADIFESSLVTVDAGCVFRQEVPLQLVFKQHVVLRRKAKACSEMAKRQCHNLISFEKHSVKFRENIWRTLGLSTPHDVFYACSLAEKGIHNRGPCWDERSLAEEGEQG